MSFGPEIQLRAGVTRFYVQSGAVASDFLKILDLRHVTLNNLLVGFALPVEFIEFA